MEVEFIRSDLSVHVVFFPTITLFCNVFHCVCWSYWRSGIASDANAPAYFAVHVVTCPVHYTGVHAIPVKATSPARLPAPDCLCDIIIPETIATLLDTHLLHN